ncbi:TBC1 domain family member 23 isoform X2 [Parasteatoda tepidariorum]|uniref:TBC1 domain family member 23 isoform X2 n=1 Tax=Parasteatoda tepidariorum TaxID=114398 RepID=UPI001C71EFEF|nr:TBC1 domain family member 23 isoform X2 [Parasteatoda tepidariorum]XP_042900802.1 TBC1 domain family member 23 isoform X2 [Parasteatoda tepidariorum]
MSRKAPSRRIEIRNLADRLGNEDEDRVSVLCDLESVITRYCRQSGYDYEDNWVYVLEPLVALRLPKGRLYSLFHSIHQKFIPKTDSRLSSPFHLLRLLLLYHEPELCSFLDTKKITPECYARNWFCCLFSSTCCLKVIHIMWDIYFLASDPFLIFYLALAIVINAKEQLLEMKGADKQSIIDELQLIPCQLDANDIEDFCTVAFHYKMCTPPSFIQEYYSIIYEGNVDPEREMFLSQALCLPVSVSDIISRNSVKTEEIIKYFVVDCRPASQYNNGHLSTAFHLDANLMLREPAAFGTAVEALFAVQKQANVAGSVAAGEHFCFMGSGREEEDQYVHMVVASFLRKHHSYVSLAQGGFSALHKIIPSNELNSMLSFHSPKGCLVCSSEMTINSENQEKEISIFDQLASAVKSKSSIVKEKLVEYITNPQSEEDRHVSSSDKLGKRYRGMAPVFSIGDDEEADRYTESEEESYEEVNIQTWLKKPGVIGTFVCEEIRDMECKYPSHLIVTETHLYILRANQQKKGYAYIVAVRPLSSIVKITSKRKCPEWITFAYGHIEEDGIAINSRDHLLIPKAGDATSLIKYRIYDISVVHSS